MAKRTFKLEDPNEKKIRLDDLKVKRSVEKTSEYDNHIKILESELDYFNYGIKKSTN